MEKQEGDNNDFNLCSAFPETQGHKLQETNKYIKDNRLAAKSLYEQVT